MRVDRLAQRPERQVRTKIHHVPALLAEQQLAEQARTHPQVRGAAPYVQAQGMLSFDSAVRDESSGREVRDSEFAVLDIAGGPAPAPGTSVPVERVEKPQAGWVAHALVSSPDGEEAFEMKVVRMAEASARIRID